MRGEYSRAEKEILTILNNAESCSKLGLSEFSRKVLLATMDIPAGTTLSYGELARKIGNPGASRAIGRALHYNPWVIVIPCHRVVPADYPRKVGGYRYGTELKQALLLNEKR